MENRIGSHIDGGEIINIDARGKLKRDTKFTKQETKPADFSDSIGKSTIFSFSARTRNSRLFLGSPCEKIRSEKNTRTSGKPSIIYRVSLISIRETA
jgi:hypothetical protein